MAPRKTISKASLAKIEEICAELPGTELEKRYDHYNIAVRKKTYAWQLNDHHGDGRVAIAIKASPQTQQLLIEMDPHRFFVPAYLGHSGWVGVMLEGKVDWAGVESLLRDGWRLTASKRAVAQLDGAAPTARRR